MLTRTQDSATITAEWLGRFEEALNDNDGDRLGALFHPDSHWRDVLAFTWTITTFKGCKDILETLRANAAAMSPKGFSTGLERTPPRTARRAGVETIEAIFGFETAFGKAHDAAGVYRAWTLFTALDDLGGRADEATGIRQRCGDHVRDFRGPNWLDNRKSAMEYADRDPAVIVVGAGQAGLSIAAHLTDLGIDTLVVDRETRIGDNWRKRYHALTLHNQTHVNHLPFMPFPPNWPTYIPKDKLAGWFEAYAESMELNCWIGTDLEGGSYDRENGVWTVSLRLADGRTRVMHPRHLVMATGVSGIPNRPEIPTLERFAGTVMHASQYGDGEDWRGRRAIVIGTGSSGHDIAQDLHSAGADVALVQRSPTMVVNIEPSAQLPYALYDDDLPLDDCDLVAMSMPLSLFRASHRDFTRMASIMDKPLLDGLERRGFKLDFGDDGTGWQFKYLMRGGGYYFNVGCSDLIVEGKIRLVQWSNLEGFVPEGARLGSGETVGADLIVLATGYKGQDHLVRRLFGDDVADTIGPIWGFGDNDELRNMFTRTNQPGLWFIAGSLAQCRIYSKYLGLQIKASELGLLP